VAGDAFDAARVVPVLRALGRGLLVTPRGAGYVGPTGVTPIVSAAFSGRRHRGRRFAALLDRLDVQVVVVAGHTSLAHRAAAAATAVDAYVVRVGAGRGVVTPDPPGARIVHLAADADAAATLVAAGRPPHTVQVAGDPVAAGWRAVADDPRIATDLGAVRLSGRSEPLVTVACDSAESVATVAAAVHALSLMHTVSVVWKIPSAAVRAAVTPMVGHCQPIALIDRPQIAARVRLTSVSQVVITDRVAGAPIHEIAGAFGCPVLTADADDLVGAAEEQLDRVIGPRPASAVADAAAEACARVVSGACRGIADPESLAS